MTEELIKNLGPLAPLAGIWEGEKGDDTAPSDDRGTETNKYRERITLDPFPPVDNHEQWLYGLRYATTAWRLGEDNPFHEELGYWLWDPKEKQVLKCFIVPRGVTVISRRHRRARCKILPTHRRTLARKPMASVRINFWTANSKPCALSCK